ncbi:MAG: NAD(+) synthase [Clostridia bacterium]|nr:NAD(+) synthase [Clostridia bacterium]
MRDWANEEKKRVDFLRRVLKNAHSDGFVFGNSGGKDCALVGILCKKACENTVGIIMPCESKQNYTSDKKDALELGEKFNIEMRTVDLTQTKKTLVSNLEKITKLNNPALTNINPRLRMTTLYAVGAAENKLVVGTGNKSERYLGYFTKWGDGAFDVNPIADLRVEEIYEFLEYFDAPLNIRTKAPSAGLFEGQTDEDDMGVTYKSVDAYLRGETVSEKDRKTIEAFHSKSEHKRAGFLIYEDK